MPVSCWVDERSGVLWQKWTGFIHLEEVVRFERSARDSQDETRDTIVDLTELTGTDITAEQMSYLAALPQRARRLAIVAPNPARFGRARMFENLAESQGSKATVRAFRTAAEAERWVLGSG